MVYKIPFFRLLFTVTVMLVIAYLLFGFLLTPLIAPLLMSWPFGFMLAAAGGVSVIWATLTSLILNMKFQLVVVLMLLVNIVVLIMVWVSELIFPGNLLARFEGVFIQLLLTLVLVVVPLYKFSAFQKVS